MSGTLPPPAPVRRTYVPTAANPQNQSLLQKLAEHKAKYDTKPRCGNLSRTLATAMAELKAHKQPVKSFADALKVKRIGRQIANMLFPSESADATTLESLFEESEPERPSSKSRKKTSSTAKESSPASVGSSSSLTSNCHAPSSKQAEYDRALGRSSQQYWKGQGLKWKVLFLLDERERLERDRLSEKFSSANIPFEIRTLPVGDMTWIAQGRRNGKVVAELVLGTIIERKTLSDLVSSIHGTRYVEQRIRLNATGLSQRLLLIEGNLHRDTHIHEKEMNLQKCHSAVWESAIYLGFQTIRTNDAGETIAMLKLLHRRILHRSFPSAFFDETLPTFTEPSRVAGSRATQEQLLEVGKRKRRRHQSLHELEFDIEPSPSPGMDRFVTYEELKAKVERDREAELRTVRMLHAAMIKQVPTIESKKTFAILNKYPTPTSLFTAYKECTSEVHKVSMVKEIDTAMPGHLARRKCFVGNESSKQLFIAYGFSQKAREHTFDEDLPAREHASLQGKSSQSQAQSLYAFSAGSPFIYEDEYKAADGIGENDGFVAAATSTSASVKECRKTSAVNNVNLQKKAPLHPCSPRTIAPFTSESHGDEVDELSNSSRSSQGSPVKKGKVVSSSTRRESNASMRYSTSDSSNVTTCSTKRVPNPYAKRKDQRSSLDSLSSLSIGSKCDKLASKSVARKYPATHSPSNNSVKRNFKTTISGNDASKCHSNFCIDSRLGKNGAKKDEPEVYEILSDCE